MGPLPVLVHSEMRGIDHADKCPIFSWPPNSPCFSKGSSYTQALRVGSRWAARVYVKQGHACEHCPVTPTVSRAHFSRPTCLILAMVPTSKHISLLSLEQKASDRITIESDHLKTGKKDEQGGVLVIKGETHTTVIAHSSAWHNCLSTNQQSSIIDLVNSSRKKNCLLEGEQWEQWEYCPAFKCP